MADLPPHLLRHGFAIERAGAVSNLRRALLDVQSHVQALLEDLDADPASHLYGGAARTMAAAAGEAARHAGELDMANRLRFLMLTTPDEKS